MAKKRKPFELKLDEDKRTDLALELAHALDDAMAARSAKDSDIRYWHTLYEQGRTRTAKNSPWPDAADLTSYLGTFYVDTLRAQIVETVMDDPICVVEGYGDAEKTAPFVEEFHQWQAEAEGFQNVFARSVHLGLIEPRGVLEVYEDSIKRPVRKVIRAALQLNPLDGSAMVDEKLKPLLQRKPDGSYIEATDPNMPSAEVEIDAWEAVCRGPRERTIAYRDYLQLPGHASEKAEVWGHFKRFYRRLDQLQERVEAGIYDKEAVEALGADDERASETTLAGDPIGVAAKDGDRVEKELWEGMILRDLDGKGPRWFVVTLSKDKQVILRLQYDDVGMPRFFSLVPFPRPNSTEGYSYIGHKLITAIEEDTAWRNLDADDASMQLQLPLKRKTTSTWDPDAEPLGPKAVMTVREMGEVEFLQRQPNTGVAGERIERNWRGAERLSMINDAAAGVTSENQRTLGEIQLITNQSRGRVKEAIKNVQETVEEIYQVRHVMWKRALADLGSEGMQAPPSVVQNLRSRLMPMPGLPADPNVPSQAAGMPGQMPGQMPGMPPGMPPPQGMPGLPMPQQTVPVQAGFGLEARAPDITAQLTDLRFTAQMMEGSFRFKPKGSVENADRNRQRYDAGQGFMQIANVAKVNPMVAMLLSTPQAAKAMVEQWVRLYNVPDKQAFLGSEAMAAMQQMMQAQMMQQTMAPPGAAPAPNGPPQPKPPQPGAPA